MIKTASALAFSGLSAHLCPGLSAHLCPGLAPYMTHLWLLFLLLSRIRWRIHWTRKSQPFCPCTTACTRNKTCQGRKPLGRRGSSWVWLEDGLGGGIQYVGSERPRRGCSCEAGDGEVKFGIMGGSWRLFLRGWRVMGEMWDHVGGECYFSGARGWRTKCWIKTAPENWVGEHKNIEKRMSVVPVTLRLPGGFPWKGKHLLKIPFLQLWSTKKCRS